MCKTYWVLIASGVTKVFWCLGAEAMNAPPKTAALATTRLQPK